MGIKTDINDTVKKITQKLEKYETKISKIISEIDNSKEVSNLYYSSKIKELNGLWTEMKVTFSELLTPELRKGYNKSISDGVSRIKNYKITFSKKTETAIKKLKTKTLLNSDYSARTFKNILNDSISAFVTGIEQGKKTFLRFLNETQQLAISEKTINEQIVKGIIEKGSVNAAKKNIKDKLKSQLEDGKIITIIDKNGKPRNYNVRDYAELVARTKLINAQAQGTIDIAREVNQDLVQVSNHNTDCDVCGEIEGRVFSISGNDPDFDPLDFEFPLHPNCYDKTTDILTKRGWINIMNVEKNDLCLSLNLNTLNLEWIKIIKLIKTYEKEMLRFFSRYIDICVTKNHNMIYQNDTNRKKKNNKFEFVKAIDVFQKKSGRFISGCNWNGEKDNIDNLLFEFYGYYLSEGSIYKPKDKNTYYIQISQSEEKNKNKYNKIINCLEKLFPKKHLCKDIQSIRFYDKKLGETLAQLGKSENKYIPDFILNANKDKIRIFLDAFRLGDGSERKRFSNFLNFEIIEKTYFTSSKKMADQLSELILKVEKRPSFYINKTKGKEINFKNGKYKINNDVYVIRECNSIFHNLFNLKFENIKYNDFAYCVELEKNNTLYTRRNGKCLWSGNCRHTLTVIFREIIEKYGVEKYA